MKKFSTLFLALATTLAFAQIKIISFEESEGYRPGDINGQQGWVSTPTDDGNVEGQVVTAELAKTGTKSFKITELPQYEPQDFPVIGGNYIMSPSYAFNGSSVSTDVWISELDASNFLIGLLDEKSDDFGVLLEFDYQGTIYVADLKANGDPYLVDTKAVWAPNKWMNVRMDTSGGQVKYYLDDVLIYKGATITDVTNIKELDLVHDNYGGYAYFDNVKVGQQILGLENAAKADLAVFPNPVKDVLNVRVPAGEKLQSAELYNAAGAKVKSSAAETSLNLGGIAPGVYILRVKTAGKEFSKKIIKQ